MSRDARAYLFDILQSCDGIDLAVHGLDFASYESNRVVRMSVEREFIIIGEAISALSRLAPAVFDSITGARRIVDFRNQLTHEYPTVDDELVWAIIGHDVPALRWECQRLYDETSAAGGEG